MILLDLPQQWQITHQDHPSQISYCTSREKRFLGLPNDLLIILLALIMIPSFSRIFIQEFLKLWLLKGLLLEPILSLMIYCLKLFEFKVLCLSLRFLELKVWGLKVLNLGPRRLED